jgi:hypothetical protein
VEEFGASGLALRRIVEGIIVEKSWKHLVNAAPVVLSELNGRHRGIQGQTKVPGGVHERQGGVQGYEGVPGGVNGRHVV